MLFYFHPSLLLSLIGCGSGSVALPLNGVDPKEQQNRDILWYLGSMRTAVARSKTTKDNLFITTMR